MHAFFYFGKVIPLLIYRFISWKTRKKIQSWSFAIATNKLLVAINTNLYTLFAVCLQSTRKKPAISWAIKIFSASITWLRHQTLINEYTHWSICTKCILSSLPCYGGNTRCLLHKSSQGCLLLISHQTLGVEGRVRHKCLTFWDCVESTAILQFVNKKV